MAAANDAIRPIRAFSLQGGNHTSCPFAVTRCAQRRRPAMPFAILVRRNSGAHHRLPRLTFRAYYAPKTGAGTPRWTLRAGCGASGWSDTSRPSRERDRPARPAGADCRRPRRCASTAGTRRRMPRPRCRRSPTRRRDGRRRRWRANGRSTALPIVSRRSISPRASACSRGATPCRSAASTAATASPRTPCPRDASRRRWSCRRGCRPYRRSDRLRARHRRRRWR
jgi:hypothetical protein